ncbi:MAG: hypothetical protein JWM28_4312 [Chitinophagaceae bacterium]|nr:hypothetical protein [Chitinophagaceae bacterium]
MNVVIIILIIIAIPLILALFLTDEYVIERDIIINRPQEEVFNFVKLVKNSDYFNKWVMMDPNMKKDYAGTDGTVGFVYRWDSNNKNVGKGEQEITKIDDKRIDYEIRFKKPFEGTSTAYIATEPVSPIQTKVTWVFKGMRNYPMKIMHFLLNLKKMLGKDLATGLATLKTVLEK